jgi:hypothetical protein
MKRIMMITVGTGFCTAWILAVILATAPAVQARSAEAVEGAVFNVSQSINDNLKIYTGKDVVVHLRSGKSLQGYVKSVGNHFLHLEKLSGRDFYDALIRIDDISAMEAKFREMK